MHSLKKKVNFLYFRQTTIFEKNFFSKNVTEKKQNLLKKIPRSKKFKIDLRSFQSLHRSLLKKKVRLAHARS